jgi:hypothetical protein
MRLFAFALSSAFFVGCSSGDFEVGATEGDAAVDTGSIAADSTTEETGDTGETLDTTADDTGTSPDTTTPPPPDASGPEVIGTDAVVIDAGPPVDASTSCTTNAECGTSNFCFRTGCGAGAVGKCGPVPSGLSNYGPVCGCDGITYWNTFHAATFSVGVRSEGPCPLDMRVTCANNSDCPSSAECVFQYEDATGCTSGAKGACWRMPSGKICPIGKSGPPMKTCGAASLCTSQCEAVKAKLLFYPEACGV